MIHNDTELSNFVFAVKQSITFNGTINTTTIAPLNNLTFRAINEIEVLPGFETSLGSQLDLQITPCN